MEKTGDFRCRNRMTEKQNAVKSAELQVKTAKLNVSLARFEMEQGIARLTAKFNIQCNDLKVAYEQSLIDLQHEELNLVFSKDSAEKGFEE